MLQTPRLCNPINLHSCKNFCVIKVTHTLCLLFFTRLLQTQNQFSKHQLFFSHTPMRNWTTLKSIKSSYFFSYCYYTTLLSLLLHRASCRFTNHHTTNKCTNYMSFILNHFLKTLSLLLHVSIAYRLSSSGSTYSS